MKASDYQLERQFVWTAIPAGRVIQNDSGQVALVSLLLTPRLIGQGTSLTLSDFGMQHWPERLATVKFMAQIQNVDSRAAEDFEIKRVPFTTLCGEKISFSQNEQISAWNALFGSNLFVRPYSQISYAQRKVRTFPAAEAAKEASRAYGGAARAHLENNFDAPQLNPKLRASLKKLRETWETGIQRADERKNELGTETPPLYRAYDFYRREDHGSDFTMPTMDLDAVNEVPEFHDIVAKLSDHPTLLRALGLVIDLAVPVGALTTTGKIRITPDWRNSAGSGSSIGWDNSRQTDLCPQTFYELSGSRFIPKSTDRIKRGMLAIGGANFEPSANPRWEVITFDVDGAVVRMVSSALNSPGDDALPALRSMGLALVQHDREKMHKERVCRSQALASPQALHNAVLDAEDLLGGYRLDVLDARTGQWRSLCERRVRYTIGDLSLPKNPRPTGPQGLLEEGYVRPLSASTGAAPTNALYIHETAIRWVGWSHAVQRPDRIVETGSMPSRPLLAPPFQSQIEPEQGSLPRLQFGRLYRLRIRMADLIGGGLRLNEVSFGEEHTEVLPHYRFEPILPPEIVPTRKYQDGDGHDRMVIRSDRDVSVENYANIHGYRPYDLRFLLAPKSSLELALQHRNTFDRAIGANASAEDIRKYYEVAKRADRDLTDINGAYTVGFDTDSNSPDYVVVPEQGVTIPWLSDPICKDTAFHFLSRPLNEEGQPGQYSGQLPQKRMWNGDWHSRLPVSLRLIPANTGCVISDPDEAAPFKVALGPAEEITLQVSSCPLSDDVDLLGIAAWLPGSGHSITPEQKEAIAWGKHRMISPRQTITLVHAVQRPLCDPCGQLKPDRKVGETICILNTSELKIHTASTGRIDIYASWEDWEDLVSKPLPCKSKHSVQLGSYDIPYGQLKLPEIRQEFGDTRRRRVTYNITAISRFQDYFAHITAANPEACHAYGQLLVTDVPCSSRPPAPKLLYTVPTFRWEQSSEGGILTRTRYGGGLRVFFERPWFVSGEDEALGVLTWQSDWQPPQNLSYISVAGRDPVWNTDAPPFILTGDFITAPAKTKAYLQEGSQTLPVLLHKVQFDKEGNRWYCDIDLSKVVGWSYFPFVRLALARYQENTVDQKDKLSTPVLTEPIQLPPTRQLTVIQAPGHVNVTLEGLGPVGPKQNLFRAEVQVLEAGYAIESMDESRSGITEVQIEPDNAIAGWTTIYSTSGTLTQSLSLDVPKSGLRPMRLLVQEFEIHPPQLSDTGSVADDSVRLVYADTVPLRNS